MIQVNYILLFQRMGLPLYSRCFGDFCQKVSRNEGFLNEFLMMVTKISKMFVEDMEEVKNTTFGDNIFFFYCVEQCSIIVVIGLKQPHATSKTGTVKTREMISDLVSNIQNLVHEEFPQFRTSHSVSENELQEFENKLFFNVLDPWYHRHGGKDACPFKDRCMVSIRSPFWEELKKIFEDVSS